MRFTWTLRIAGAGLLLCCAVASWGEEPLTVVSGRIPYMTETVGHVVVTTVPDNAGGHLTLEVSAPGGKVIGAGPVVPGQRSIVEFPVGEFAEGKTQLRCRLLSSGKEVAVDEVTLTKLPPKPNAVQVDNRRRGLIVDGLPFFPFGFWNMKVSGPGGDAGIPPDLAAQGFNLYMPLFNGKYAPGEEQVRAWIDKCAELGMKVIFDLRYDCFSSREADLTPEARRTISMWVEAFRDHPALLSWYISDEPIERDYERIASSYDLVKGLDPYHPVVIQGPGLFPPYVPAGKSPSVDWHKITDVTWLDAYPVNTMSRDQQDNRYWKSEVAPEARRGVAMVTAFWLTRDDSFFGHDMPLWHCPQLVGGGGVPFASQEREPSAQEVRAMTYAGLLSGATCMQSFYQAPGNCPKSPYLWAETIMLVQEISEMTPFLLSEDPRRQVTGSSSGIMAGGWQDRGMVLVMALNADNAPTGLKVTLANSTYSGPAEVLFENRQVQVRNGVIEDTIEAQGTRVYQIPEGPFPANLAEIDPDNLRVNPSFEEWFNPGSPADSLIVRTDVGCTCFLDARTAVNGRHSLRMTASDGERITLHSIKTDLQPGKPHRVSIWAKADRPGLGMRLILPHTDRADGQQVAVSTEWREYSFIATAQNEPYYFHSTENAVECVSKLEFTGPGVVWLDMFQIVPAE